MLNFFKYNYGRVGDNNIRILKDEDEAGTKKTYVISFSIPSLSLFEDVKLLNFCFFHLLTLAYVCTSDVALDILEHHPRLAISFGFDNFTPIYVLAQMPKLFPSGGRLWFWQRWIYSCK